MDKTGVTFQLLRKHVAAAFVSAALASSALATVHSFNVVMNGSQEVPPNGSPGTCTAQVDIDDVAMSYSISGTYSNLLSNQTLAHVHIGAPGVSGGILITLFGTGGTSGTIGGGGGITAQQVVDALNGLHYLNIHTTGLGAGEIRGQISDNEPGIKYCMPGLAGVANCPCSAPDTIPSPQAAAGHGCSNAVFTAGGYLSGSGVASLGGDSLTLNVIEASNGLTIFMEGNTNTAGGLPFGDGIRCASGSLIRFGQQNGVAGAASYPSGASPSISSITNPPSGAERYYAVFYRSSAGGWCNPSTFNITNGYRLTWQM